jgi:hypothetical protein
MAITVLAANYWVQQNQESRRASGGMVKKHRQGGMIGKAKCRCLSFGMKLKSSST